MDYVQSDGFDSENEIDEFFQSLIDKVNDGYSNLVQSGMEKVDEYISFISGLENSTSSSDTSNNVTNDQNNTDIDSSEVDEDISQSKYQYAIEEAIESGSQSFISFLDDIDEDRGEILDELYEENTQQIYDLKEDLLEDLEDAMDNVLELIDESFEHLEDNEYVKYIKHAYIQAQQDLDDSYFFEQSTLALDDYPDHWMPHDQDPEQFQYSKPLMEALEDIYNVHNIQSHTDQKSDKRQDIYKYKFLAMLPSRLKQQTQQG